MTYIHKLPQNPKQANLGHKLYRHIRLGFSTTNKLSIENSCSQE